MVCRVIPEHETTLHRFSKAYTCSTRAVPEFIMKPPFERPPFDDHSPPRSCSILQFLPRPFLPESPPPLFGFRDQVLFQPFPWYLEPSSQPHPFFGQQLALSTSFLPPVLHDELGLTPANATRFFFGFSTEDAKPTSLSLSLPANSLCIFSSFLSKALYFLSFLV